ncbi:hypothetical protein KIN20_028037 [Parelaphostrongylus tenuis]|uniref:Uncharacterized protein n=1 Tax=Parelaphostrongylus tenuis TaxID=148309 RepID=A0AAD5WEB0_PARTN|nr:hypothetical protein KIN20_028037 [Parelaphostrongylus tenuis]
MFNVSRIKEDVTTPLKCTLEEIVTLLTCGEWVSDEAGDTAEKVRKLVCFTVVADTLGRQSIVVTMIGDNKAAEIARKEAEMTDEKEVVHRFGLRFRVKQTHYIG